MYLPLVIEDEYIYNSSGDDDDDNNDFTQTWLQKATYKQRLIDQNSLPLLDVEKMKTEYRRGWMDGYSGYRFQFRSTGVNARRDQKADIRAENDENTTPLLKIEPALGPELNSSLDANVTCNLTSRRSRSSPL